MSAGHSESEERHDTPTWRTLESRIIEEIGRQGGRVTFRRLMELALYHPPGPFQEGGYYSGGKVRFGPSGDFFTGPDLHSPFYGQCIAAKLAEFWQRLGCPSPFTLVEMGGGSGVLSRDVLTAVRAATPEFAASLQLVMLEVSPLLLRRQMKMIDDSKASGLLASASLMPLRPITGCFLSNELVDSMPFHRLVFADGRLGEVYVGYDGGQFFETLDAPSDPAIEEYLERRQIRVADGTEFCVNLLAEQWIGEVARSLARGFAITIDYGFSSPDFLAANGSKPRFYGPRTDLGSFDITADVDFSSLIGTGESHGLKLETLQDEVDYTRGFAHYDLGMPGNGGRARYVMVQSKGV